MLKLFKNQDFSYYRFFPILFCKFEIFINFYRNNHPCCFMYSLFNICIRAGTEMVSNLVVSDDCVIARLVIACFSFFFLVNDSSKHFLVESFNVKVAFLLHNWLNRIGI